MQKEKKFVAKNGIPIMIRPASPDDSCAILNTVRSNAMERSYILMEQYGKNVDTEKEFIRGLDANKNLLIVAAGESQVVGCLAALQADGGMRPETRHIVHVGLHLSEPFRGLGIGHRLLEYSIEWAGVNGFEKLEANIFTTNRRSLSLFSKAGFVEEGVRRNSIRIGSHLVNEVLMGRMLRTQAGPGEHPGLKYALHRSAA